MRMSCISPSPWSFSDIARRKLSLAAVIRVQLSRNTRSSGNVRKTKARSSPGNMMRSMPETSRLFTSAAWMSSRPAPWVFFRTFSKMEYASRYMLLLYRANYFCLFRRIVKAVAHQGEKKLEARGETPATEATQEAAALDLDDLLEHNFSTKTLSSATLALALTLP